MCRARKRAAEEMNFIMPTGSAGSATGPTPGKLEMRMGLDYGLTHATRPSGFFVLFKTLRPTSGGVRRAAGAVDFPSADVLIAVPDGPLRGQPRRLGVHRLSYVHQVVVAEVLADFPSP